MILAVVISAMRLLLPYVHHYRVDLQNQINKTYNTNVEIGSLSMDWQKFGPVLVANKVSVLKTDSAAVFIDSIDIRVDFWRSLQHRTFITRGMTLGGARVFIDKTVLENNTVSATDSKIYERFSDLFLLHINKFSLANSQLIVRTENGDRKVIIDHLNWLNEGDRHRGSGAVMAYGLSTNTANVLMDFSGTEFEHLSGQIYLKGHRVNVTPWLDQALVIDDEKSYSELNVESWLTIKNGEPTNLQVALADTKLRWIIDEQEHEFLLRSGVLNADINGSNIKVKSAPFDISVDGHTWQPLYINAAGQGRDWDAYVSGVELGSIAKLVPLFVDSPALTTTLSGLKPQGRLQDIHVQQVNGELAATAELVNFSQHFSQGVPGIANVNADLVVKDEQLVAKLQASNSALDFAQHFKQPMPFDDINAELQLSWQDSGINLNVEQFAFNAPSLALTGQVNISAGSEQPATMALLANIERGDARHASLYYPHLLMGNDLVDYLNSSIIQGELNQGQVLFNGAFSDFPFNDKQGIFVVDAELANARFQFDPQWPVIEQMAANLNFTNNGMLITAREGNLVGLNVAGVTAEIADLTNEQLLVVNADIANQQPEHVTELMVKSPLEPSVGQTLLDLTVSQPVSGHFKLELPLQHSEDVIASGYVDFNDNQLELATPQMSFAKVNGRLSYHNDKIDTKDIKLMWRDMPLSVDVTGRDQGDYYQALIDLAANWQLQHWQKEVPESLKKYADGDLNWQGQLVLNMHNDGGFSYQADLESDLVAADLKLPAPYRKHVKQTLPLKASVTGQLDKSTVTVSAGDELSFYGVLEHQDTRFHRAHLVLGNDTMLLPMDGFHITTKLSEIEFTPWNNLIGDILASLPNGTNHSTQSKAAKGLATGGQGTASLFPTPERIRGNVEQLNIIGQSLTNVSFNLLDQEQWWLLRLNAKEARSEVKFYPNWQQQGIEIDADFIHFAAETGDNIDDSQQSEQLEEIAAKPFDYQQSLALFSSIPRINLMCDHCKVGKLDLGEVSFQVKHQGDTLLLENFKASRNKSSLELEASWQLTPEQSITKVTGELDISKLEREFEKLDYATVIKDSGMESKFDIHWQGGPSEFTLAKLNGKLDIDIDDGYLSEVSDKGARIFSVLSLQSLVRKLTLDFRDIFSDGMFYTYIRADMQINDGVLYTDNTRMKGAAGDLSVKGNTNLGEGALDYRMSYKPNLTSSLPVLAWIATLNPVTFLAGVAIDQVFTSQVVSEFNFELTGSINDPVFKEVNRKTRDVSVGRSTPPKFVENQTPPATENGSGKNLTPQLPLNLNQSLNQYNDG